MKAYILLRLPSGLLATRVALHGLPEIAQVRLVIDSGAAYTVVHPRFLEKIAAIRQREVSVRTLERIIRLPVFAVEYVSVFGVRLDHYPILAYSPAAFTPGIDGVLSVDILRALKARIDFAAGVLTLP